ncbi:MAG: VTT domain-containing protein [Vicinamibacteria bacterium]|nr:VTT domain-containing protein [Vicinamibacteria bacterium]
MEIVHELLWFLKPEGIQWLIQTGGLPVICLIIFAETGFFALLPGDSLLVLCGIFAATLGTDGQPLLPLWALLALVPICGILGDQIGYWIGSWFGKALYGWNEKSFLGIPIYKRAYLTKTEEFYGRWGTFFVVAGRWVPIVRTFAPIVAGMVRMRFATFIAYNVIGAFTWVWSMVLAGYFLPPILKTVAPGFDLARNIDKIAIVIIALSLAPIAWTVHKERQRQK